MICTRWREYVIYEIMLYGLRFAHHFLTTQSNHLTLLLLGPKICTVKWSITEHLPLRLACSSEQTATSINAKVTVMDMDIRQLDFRLSRSCWKYESSIIPERRFICLNIWELGTEGSLICKISKWNFIDTCLCHYWQASKQCPIFVSWQVKWPVYFMASDIRSLSRFNISTSWSLSSSKQKKQS